jgi:hypothetical protein
LAGDKQAARMYLGARGGLHWSNQPALEISAGLTLMAIKAAFLASIPEEER